MSALQILSGLIHRYNKTKKSKRYNKGFTNVKTRFIQRVATTKSS